jgi:uncharacterized protein (PEP-CTERM system associated)
MGTTRPIRATEAANVRSDRARAALLPALALLLIAAPAKAQNAWGITPTLSADLTWTNNVDLLPKDERKGDLVLTVTPGLRVDYKAPRAELQGYVSVPILLYARTGAENNEVQPQVNLLGRTEVVEDFFFVEAAASVQQTYYNPFGPTPPGLVNATDNRLTTSTYRVSPYIQGAPTSYIRYRLQNDNIWSNLGNSPIADNSVYVNHLFGSIDRDPTPLGWGVDIDRSEYWFQDRNRTQLLELVRLRGIYQPDPVWRFFVTGGYEHNRFTLTDYSGAIYGAGLQWRPDERTRLDAAWEQRFFGASYLFSFDHRAPLSAVNFSASRNITSYPQELASLPAGTFVPGVLNEILQSRISDPAERARYIAQFMDQRGLPIFLTDPIALYTEQIYLKESVSGTVGLLGARNSVFLNAFWLKTTPISGSGQDLPPDLGALENNTQAGVGVSWSYALTPTASLTTGANYLRTRANAPLEGLTNQWTARSVLTRTISPRTTAYAGVRYQHYVSDIDDDYDEAAVFIGISHSFR